MPRHIRKGQTLLLVFMFLLLISIIMAGAASMWQSGFQTTALFKEATVAFYIANAAAERANFQLAQDIDNLTSITDAPFAGGNYSYVITSQGVNKREVKITGKFRSSDRRIKLGLTQGTIEIKDNNGNHWGWRNKKDRNTWIEE